jgi:hypothetical protein
VLLLVFPIQADVAKVDVGQFLCCLGTYGRLINDWPFFLCSDLSGEGVGSRSARTHQIPGLDLSNPKHAFRIAVKDVGSANPLLTMAPDLSPIGKMRPVDNDGSVS